MVSIRTVVVVILDSRRRTSTETKYVKNLTIVVIAQLFEQWRHHASENPMRDIRVEWLMFERRRW